MQLKQKNKKHRTKGKTQATKHNICKPKLLDKRSAFKSNLADLQNIKMVGYIGTTDEFELEDLRKAIAKHKMSLVHPDVNILDYIQVVDYLIVLDVDEQLQQLVTHQGHSNIYYFGEKNKNRSGKHCTSLDKLMQSLTSSVPKPHAYLKDRGFSVIESVNYDEQSQELQLSGLCRGPWNANQLCHIPNCGDFPISKIVSWQRDDNMMDSGTVLSVSDENCDQAVYTDNQIHSNDTDMDLGEVYSKMDDLEMDEKISEGEELAGDFKDGLSNLEREAQYESFIQKQVRDHLDFPDEIENSRTDLARELYKDYRGLESFKSSPWDPYDNLPESYSQLFEFKGYRAMKCKFQNEVKKSTVRNVFATLHIKFPCELLQSIKSKPIVWNLWPLETRATTVNMSIMPSLNYDPEKNPIKSNDELIVQYGFRRYKINPIFSKQTSNSRNDVHKLDPFLNSACIVSAVLPVTFQCGPVLYFRESCGVMEFIGSGCLENVNFKRIVARRIILTADPFKVKATHKGVVARFMFFNAQDVVYFKPIKLFTKCGRRGRIKESLGTHGYMKCIFNQPIQHQDTICMALYKRVFPNPNFQLYKEK
eukprot:NODE_149_length_17312_cov_0.399349.p2 type:complete len:591 gc:universal NODE_149_length_17312_cov_0.399349:8929-10701(+)